MTQAKKRVAWVDMAKGYGIILMLIGHLHVNELMVWIYSFHMPLFFFVSGYLFSVKTSFLDFTASKVRRMVIPYLFLYIPMLLADLWLAGTLSWGQIFEDLRLNLVQQRHSALWFLGCLIAMHFLFYPIVRFVRNRMAGTIISLLLGLVGVLFWRNGINNLFWNFDIALVAAPFFYVGYLLQGKIDEASIRKLKVGRYCLILLAMLIASVGIAHVNSYCFLGREIDLFESLFREEWISYTAAFVGIAFIVLLSARMSIRFIKYIGEHSLLFYAWHFPIVMLPILKICERMGIMHLHSGWMSLLQNGLILTATLVILTLLNELVIRTRLRFIVGR